MPPTPEEIRMWAYQQQPFAATADELVHLVATGVRGGGDPFAKPQERYQAKWTPKTDDLLRQFTNCSTMASLRKTFAASGFHVNARQIRFRWEKLGIVRPVSAAQIAATTRARASRAK